MGKIKLFALASVISTLSFSTFAAEQIHSVDPTLQQVAVVSVHGAGSPDELIEKLSKRVDSVGADKFKIIMTESNDNTERGTAIAYK